MGNARGFLPNERPLRRTLASHSMERAGRRRDEPAVLRRTRCVGHEPGPALAVRQRANLARMRRMWLPAKRRGRTAGSA
jgi:hypothetical protein